MDAVDTVCSGHSTQWRQFAVDTVHSGHSGMVVYGGGDIVFGAKRSNQWIQYAVDAVRSEYSTVDEVE